MWQVILDSEPVLYQLTLVETSYGVNPLRIVHTMRIRSLLHWIGDSHHQQHKFAHNLANQCLISTCVPTYDIIHNNSIIYCSPKTHRTERTDR